MECMRVLLNICLALCLAFNAFSVLNFRFEIKVISEHSPQPSFSELNFIGAAETVHKRMHSGVIKLKSCKWIQISE